MPISKKTAYRNGVISFFAFLFTLFVTYFTVADYLGGFHSLKDIKPYLYIVFTVFGYIFSFLLKDHWVGLNAFFAITFVTNAVVIPFQLLESFSGLSVYIFYLVSSFVVLMKISHFKQKIIKKFQEQKIDVFMGILLLFMLPSIFAHLAAFWGAKENTKV